MDVLLGAGLGAFIKFYDDITDLKIPVGDKFKEILKGLIISLFTVLSYNDFSFSITSTLTLVGSNIVDSFDDPFWHSLYTVSAILSIIFISFEGSILLRTIFLFSFILIAVLEPLIIKEEKSVRKTILRLLSCFIAIFLLNNVLFQYFYSKIYFVNKLLAFALGYFLTSVLISFMNFEPIVYKDTIPVDTIANLLKIKIDKQERKGGIGNMFEFIKEIYYEIK